MVQRVREARVRVGDEEVAAMGPGLLALVGVARADGPEDAEALAEKLVHLRILADAEGRPNLSLLDAGGTLGVVSQFSLLGDARKGRRPSWLEAAPPERAEPLVTAVTTAARRAGVSVVCGRFGAAMAVSLVNEGPLTVLLDTRHLF